jgi:hypothetical protein
VKADDVYRKLTVMKKWFIMIKFKWKVVHHDQVEREVRRRKLPA